MYDLYKDFAAEKGLPAKSVAMYKKAFYQEYNLGFKPQSVTPVERVRSFSNRLIVLILKIPKESCKLSLRPMRQPIDRRTSLNRKTKRL